ncbi:MAG: RpiB/LacA/LacB family sugar-phosphate isomerase [Holosporales bacterium]|jgi:ribose 5-phosphate isomerase B|nr:RpiB/LacA/LacB family sugar-phosphate isomerase [Holosporales bacterium]
MSFKSVAFGSDHRGYWLKNKLLNHFSSLGYQVMDYGSDNDCVTVDYVDYAKSVAKHVQLTPRSFGVLVCYSGVGMCVTANRFKGIRAALCYKSEITALAREHNDANIICFGAGFINEEFAVECAGIFANTELDEQYLVRINKIDEAEK